MYKAGAFLEGRGTEIARGGFLEGGGRWIPEPH